MFFYDEGDKKEANENGDEEMEANTSIQKSDRKREHPVSDDDFEIVDDPMEGSSAKKRKVVPEEEDDLIILEDLL